MKKFTQINLCLVFILFLGGISTPVVFGQQNPQKTVSEYSRPSVTMFFATSPGDYNSQKAAESAEKITLSEKYFDHNLNEISLSLSQNFNSLKYEEKKIALKKQLEKEGIGRKMVAKWFSRQADGMFGLDYIHQCGLYNASDQDVLMSGAAKRGEAVLLDAGQNLVNKTYALVIVPHDFASHDDKTSHGWSANYDIFLFKLDFDDAVVSRFYEQWPFEDDPADVKSAKVATFDTLSFTFSPFYAKPAMMASSSELYALTKNPKSSDQLFDEMIAQMYNDALFNIDKDLEPFRVKVNVSGTHPIRSKIGKKEGLKCDQRYFVYEFVWNDKTGTADMDKKAVIRATGKITDNRGVATGNTGESQFYQVYGGTVRQGMMIQQRNDVGVSLLAGYELGEIGGFDAGLWIRTGFATNVPSLYIIADIGFDGGEYDFNSEGEEDFIFLRYSVGLAKGIRLARIVELTPFAAWGQESTSNDNLNYESIKTSYVKAGGVLGINITSAVSIIGQLNFYAPYGNVETTLKDEDAVTEDFSWSDEKGFKDRSGMSMMFGLRLEF